MNQKTKREIKILGFIVIFLCILINENDLNNKLSNEINFNNNTLKTSGSINVLKPTISTVVNFTISSQLEIQWTTSYVPMSRVMLYKGDAIIEIWWDSHNCYDIYGSCSFNIYKNLPANLPPGNDYRIKVENSAHSYEYDFSGSFTVINDDYTINLDKNKYTNFSPVNSYLIYTIIGLIFALHIITILVVFLPKLKVTQNFIKKMKERSRNGKKI